LCACLDIRPQALGYRTIYWPASCIICLNAAAALSWTSLRLYCMNRIIYVPQSAGCFPSSNIYALNSQLCPEVFGANYDGNHPDDVAADFCPVTASNLRQMIIHATVSFGPHMRPHGACSFPGHLAATPGGFQTLNAYIGRFASSAIPGHAQDLRHSCSEIYDQLIQYQAWFYQQEQIPPIRPNSDIHSTLQTEPEWQGVMHSLSGPIQQVLAGVSELKSIAEGESWRATPRGGRLPAALMHTPALPSETSGNPLALP
jgi:hypothetical protein